ncbi:MAG: trigger factor [Candidatus Komeilibacteria bacterium]|nr:trigger factor [Candidatus Komeilibacteria bacterium]
MQLTTKEIKPSELELTIEVSPAEYQTMLEKAATRLSQTSKIEGFRPGKASYEIVKQRFGEMAIYQEGLDNIISHFYYQAVTQEKLNTIAQPKIEIEKLAPGNPIVFKAVVALMPQVKLGNYKNVKIEKKEIKVEDGEVGKVIADIAKMQAKETLANRPAKLGDRVEVNFEVSLDKVVIEGGSGQKYPLVLGENTMIPGFEERFVGLTKDEEKTFQLKFPEQYQNKMVAGKMCDFKVKLLAIYQRELPELTDNWAKGLGATGVEDLKSKIHNNLLEEQKFHEEQRQEIEMLNKIVAATEFSEIPDVLIDSEAHRMVHEFEHSITEQGIGFTDYLQSLKKTEAELMADFKPKALERVKTSLVIKEIADSDKIEVKAEALQAETEKILGQVKGNREAEDNIKSEGYQHYLTTVLRNRQVIEMLKKEIIK